MWQQHAWIYIVLRTVFMNKKMQMQMQQLYVTFFYSLKFISPLTPMSHMEVGHPGTWGMELLTPNPGSKSTPKACATQPRALHAMLKAPEMGARGPKATAPKDQT